MLTLNKNSNLELLDYPDCPALTETGECSWMERSYCIGTSCSFFTTEEKQNDSFFRAQKRLSELDEETQARIAQKYYGGFRPWMAIDSPSKK